MEDVWQGHLGQGERDLRGRLIKGVIWFPSVTQAAYTWQGLLQPLDRTCKYGLSSLFLNLHRCFARSSVYYFNVFYLIHFVYAKLYELL